MVLVRNLSFYFLVMNEIYYIYSIYLWCCKNDFDRYSILYMKERVVNWLVYFVFLLYLCIVYLVLLLSLVGKKKCVI